ncbi:MAG: aminotransferase class III-fold pyridoxal phosphate-dependent enzyme, partial [Gammaproteobacteria bacterium]
VPPSEYFPAISSVLDEYSIDFVADEVVTGFGRTGAPFGSDTFALKPKHVTVAKAITSGYFPLSAIAIGEQLYRDLEVGSERFGVLAHAGTFSAHPVGAAAALKVLEIIERDNLIEHASAMGKIFAERLEKISDHPLVGEIRHCGLGASVDFLRRDANDVPVNEDADDKSLAVYAALLERGVVGRPAGRSLVLAPPLIVQANEIDEICTRLELALDDVLKDRK